VLVVGATGQLGAVIARKLIASGVPVRALARNREQQAARRERATLQARLGRLTPREREVFALVASGLLNKQAGHQLGTTEKTIKVHRARVMEKMEARSLADLVRMAERLGITGAPPPH